MTDVESAIKECGLEWAINNYEGSFGRKKEIKEQMQKQSWLWLFWMAYYGYL